MIDHPDESIILPERRHQLTKEETKLMLQRIKKLKPEWTNAVIAENIGQSEQWVKQHLGE